MELSVEQVSDLPLYPGTLRGYRYWCVSPGGFGSLAIWEHFWSPGVTVARCHPGLNRRNDSHVSPVPTCKCGIYAWYHPEHSMKERESILPAFHNWWLAFGVISAWGTVIPGTKGFRAEKAKIEAVWFLADEFVDWRLAEVRKRCLVSQPHTKIFDTEAEMVAAYPPQEVEWSKT